MRLCVKWQSLERFFPPRTLARHLSGGLSCAIIARSPRPPAYAHTYSVEKIQTRLIHATNVGDKCAEESSRAVAATQGRRMS